MRQFIAIALFLHLLHLTISLNPKCLDEGGSPVDWYTLYKLPRKSDVPEHPGIVDEGLGYSFITSKKPLIGWTLSNHSIGSRDSVPGKTLDAFYTTTNSQRSQLAYILYNDEHPDGNTSFTDGHTKGVVVFGPRTGFWLVHSVPKYPPTSKDGYGYPHTGQMYGQSFLCITFSTIEAMDHIGLQFAYNHPYVYDSNVPNWTLKKFPHFAMAAKGKHIRRPPYFHIQGFKSFNGILFTSFAKYTNFGKDLYKDLVAPALQVNMAVETWPNGPGRMNSSCKPPYIVENVETLTFPFKTKVKFTTHHDHSKWAVSLSNKKPTVCIGDINRMMTQEKRGGGTVCFVDRNVWKAYIDLVTELQKCPPTEPYPIIDLL